MKKGTKEARFERFLLSVADDVKKGTPLRDALELHAMQAGGNLPQLVVMATGKYQEAVNPYSPLSHQKGVDAKAFASMGKLWQGEGYDDPKALQGAEDIFVQSLYLLLRYGAAKALEANKTLPGNQKGRERLLRLFL